MRRLQNKIFLFFFCLLFLVQLAILAFVYRNVEEQKSLQIQSYLNTASNNFENQFNNRSYYLAAFAETAARDYGLKEVFAEDVRSFLVALNNHRARIDANLAMAISAEGVIKGQLVLSASQGEESIKVGAQQGLNFQYMDWLEDFQRTRLYQIGKDIYQISFSPISNGDLIIGWIGFGYLVDETLAENFQETIGLATAFIYQKPDGNQLIANTMPEARTWLDAVLNPSTEMDESEYIYRLYEMGATDEGALTAVLFGESSDLLASMQAGWKMLAVLISLTLIAASLASYWIAAGVTRPVRILVEQVRDIARGNYHRQVDVQSKDEVGILASEFDEMKNAIMSREATINHRATHDSLTGLPNRQQLHEAVENAIKENREFSLVFIAPIGMKDINYSLGHDTGDALVCEIGRRLSTLGTDILCFSIGGSNFGLILLAHHSLAVTELQEKLTQLFSSPCQSSQFSLHIRNRIGLASYPGDANSARELIQQAGTALQYAQRDNRELVYFDRFMSDHQFERIQLINGFRDAIEKDQMELYYQPKLSLLDGRVCGVEALLRWHHPVKGFISPDKFIPLAEQTGHIFDLTLWTIANALKQYQAWKSTGMEIPIAVNISAENFRQSDFVERVISLLKQFGESAEALKLEVTESVLSNETENVIAMLGKFRVLGFELSVDDYGTGYSSLDQLKHLPVSEMKIDKSFIMEMLEEKSDLIIVESTIELAHSLGLSVVAEGVEDKETLDWLALHQCDVAQGYFISKPKPAAELTRWLERYPPVEFLNSRKLA